MKAKNKTCDTCKARRIKKEKYLSLLMIFLGVATLDILIGVVFIAFGISRLKKHATQWNGT